MADSTFDRARFAALLTTRFLGRHLVARAEVESTNDVAWETLAAGAPDGTVVVADAQTRGRGRAGRRWHLAPGEGLALSALLHAGCDRRDRGVLPLAAGLALARALERVGARAALKWPNDVLMNGRKLAGILCESRGAPGPDGDDAVVIGVGVNVGGTRERFPEALRDTATSLAIEGFPVDRETVAAQLLNVLEPLWADLQEGSREAVLEAWRQRAGFWGRRVLVRTPAGEVGGIARTLDGDGGLVLALDSGDQTTVRAGDLELAPAGPR